MSEDERWCEWWALHEEVAELRAILWQIATDPLQQAELREAIEAVLTPKEGRE